MTRVLYVFIAIATVLVAVIAFAPASLIMNIAGDEIEQALPDVRFGKFEGSVWNGQTVFQFRSFPAVDASWQLSPWSLLIGSIAIDGRLKSNDSLDLQFSGRFDGSGGTIEPITGRVTGEYINQVTVNYGLDSSGTFDLNGGEAAFDQSWLTNLAGDLSWSGGIIHIETPQQIYSTRLPELTGQLSLPDGNAQLVVYDQTDKLLNIIVKPDGWAKVDVEQALMVLADLPIPEGINPDEPAVVLEEKIL